MMATRPARLAGAAWTTPGADVTYRIRITRMGGQANLYMTLTRRERKFLVDMTDRELIDLGYTSVQQYHGKPDNGVWTTLRRPPTQVPVERPAIR